MWYTWENRKRKDKEKYTLEYMRKIRMRIQDWRFENYREERAEIEWMRIEVTKILNVGLEDISQGWKINYGLWQWESESSRKRNDQWCLSRHNENDDNDENSHHTKEIEKATENKADEEQMKR